MNHFIEFAFLRAEEKIQLMEFLCPLIASACMHTYQKISREEISCLLQCN